jgi:[acyl-carrier-protein] S-malonyltransferase
MKAYVFPGQGSQFVGMGKDLYEESEPAKQLFEKANEILGFRITDLMFDGNEEGLRRTDVTQPAVFLHSVIKALTIEAFKPDMVAGHSLGEFSALVANGAIQFADGLKLVSARAKSMQKACELNPSTMAAIIGMNDEDVEKICKGISEIVVPANYNCPGQIVISGSNAGVDIACKKLTEAGARRALKLNVGGAFHSPLMEPARKELADAILATKVEKPICPIYQNVTAQTVSNPDIIKSNLVAQLTAPVKWTQTMRNMIEGGATSFTEIGPGKVLIGMVKKVDRGMEVVSEG